MVRTLAWPLSLAVVNEYPKSGGTWFGQLLAAALDIPFPRNRSPSLETCVMHGHYFHPAGIRNATVVWRDGRDLMVSYYYHCYFENGIGNSRLVALMRGTLPFDDYEDVDSNLPVFIERMLTHPLRPRFTWQAFVSRWYDKEDAIHVHYENLLADPAAELGRVIGELGREMPSANRLGKIAEEYSFERQSGRKAGTEGRGRFLRKGVAGDWKNHFTRESCEVFDRYAGEALVRLGYEKDRSWVNTPQ